MKERPILFSGPMVRAVLDGRKTQTRRIIKDEWWRCLDPEDEEDRANALTQCPFGVPGDRLWVRETWALENCGDDGQRIVWAADRAARWMWHAEDSEVFYLPSDHDPRPWRPSIHMPRWASRLTLEVVSVRVERLHDISEAAAKAEGIGPIASGGWGLPEWHTGCATPRDAFRALWDSIDASPGGDWSGNPWVWCVEFRKAEG